MALNRESFVVAAGEKGARGEVASCRLPSRGGAPQPIQSETRDSSAKSLIIIVFLLAIIAGALAPNGAQAEDSRVTAARAARDALLARRGAPAVVPAVEDAAAVEAELRAAGVENQLEENRRKVEALAAPRQKLEARGDELTQRIAKLHEDQRRRVSAIYRSAKLGAGAAGWHPEPTRSARLSRYLTSVAAVGQDALRRAEVEHGSAIASLDQLRTEETGLLASRAILEADLAEARAGVDRGLDVRGLVGAPPVFSYGAETVSAAAAENEPALDVEAESLAPTLPDGSEELVVAEAEMADGAEVVVAGAETLEDGAVEDAKEPVELPVGMPAEVPTLAEAEVPTDSALEVQAALAAVRERIHLAETQNKAAEAERLAAEKAKASALPPASQEDAEGASRELEDGPAVLGPSDNVPPAQAEAPKSIGLLSRLFRNDGGSDAFAASRGTLPAPTSGKVVANYGQEHKSGATYRGVILRSTHSAPVTSVAGGKVSYVGNVAGLGNTVIVSHGDRYHTVYSRLGPVSVKLGDSVSTGGRLGELPGDDADLHFELRDKGTAIDPLPWLRGGGPP